MSARTNPFEELERLFEQMNREFDTRLGDGEMPFAGWTQKGERTAVDLVEYDDEFVATVDLPGFEKADVDVRVTDHTLRIEAEREDELDEEDGTYVRRERRSATTHRSVRLPEEVDVEAVSARMKNGVLTVTLPRLHPETDRHVDVE